MTYREAKVSRHFPPLTAEEVGKFAHEFANLCSVAVHVNGGQVVGGNTTENYYAMAYLFGWKWRQDILIDVVKNGAFPETEFVEFVHETVTLLGLVDYDENDPRNLEMFEKVVGKVYNLVRRADNNEYAFVGQHLWNGWRLAFANRKNHHGKKQK